jgi:hypothetical protein
MSPKALVIFLVAGALAVPGRADLVYSLSGPTTVNAGDSNDVIDVLLTNTGLSDVGITGFSYQFTSSDTDITFTSADTGSPSYIYAGNSFDDVNGLTLNIPPAVPMPQTLFASDFANDATNVAVGAGHTVSLGEVFFDVAANATPGPFTVNFSCLVYFDPATSAPPNGIVSQPLADCNSLAFFDANSNVEPLNVDTLSSANIAVAAATATPEPSFLLLLLAGILAIGCAQAYRTRWASKQS